MSNLFILTLTWNGKDKLIKLKNSLLPCLEDIDFKWLIKDNASKDNTVEEIAGWSGEIKAGSELKCIPYKNNAQNFSAGMNLLFNEASPQDNDTILLLNNDVIFNDKNSIKNMLKLLNKNNVGAVGAKLLYTGTNKLQHAGVVFDKFHQMPMHYRANQACDDNANKNRYFQVVTGAVLATKAEYFRNAFDKNKSGVKGMDENYHWAFDDVDLCLSIKYNMNKDIIYCGNTNIFHEESATLKTIPSNKLFMPHNTNYFKTKWSGKYLLDKDIYTSDSKYNLYKE